MDDEIQPCVDQGPVQPNHASRLPIAKRRVEDRDVLSESTDNAERSDVACDRATTAAQAVPIDILRGTIDFLNTIDETSALQSEEGAVLRLYTPRTYMDEVELMVRLATDGLVALEEQDYRVNRYELHMDRALFKRCATRRVAVALQIHITAYSAARDVLKICVRESPNGLPIDLGKALLTPSLAKCFATEQLRILFQDGTNDPLQLERYGTDSWWQEGATRHCQEHEECIAAATARGLKGIRRIAPRMRRRSIRHNEQFLVQAATDEQMSDFIASRPGHVSVLDEQLVEHITSCLASRGRVRG